MRIGEIAARTGIKVETVRYYEREGLIDPPFRTPANYRSYGSEHLKRLNFVRRARDLGFPLGQVRELLDLVDDRSRRCEAVAALAARHRALVARKVAELNALRRELDRLIAGCTNGVVSECGVIDALALQGGRIAKR